MEALSQIGQTPLTYETFLKSYGDLLYDLSLSLLRNAFQAQISVHTIFKKLKFKKKSHSCNAYHTYEKSWILAITCKTLIHNYRAVQIQSFSRIPLKSSFFLNKPNPEIFKVFFQKLHPQDQLLLLLKDKHQIPLSEISHALHTPIESLKIKHQQILSLLSQWIWTYE